MIDWSSWVTAGSTIVLAVLTFVYVRLTKKIVESQTDPCVVVALEICEGSAGLFVINVKNIGFGIAYDIQFTFSEKLPKRAFGISECVKKEVEYFESGFLIDGIPALAPGESRKLYWGQYGCIKNILGDKKIKITCNFKKNNVNMNPIVSILEISSYSDTIVPKSSISDLVEEIKKINSNISRLSNKIK
ncbi:MAG: hypothetical protein PWQ57_474 [Desulfovibrionales bacterium]|nr:hypothetical protein [Desulfovibrionales bacterium]